MLSHLQSIFARVCKGLLLEVMKRSLHLPTLQQGGAFSLFFILPIILIKIGRSMILILKDMEINLSLKNEESTSSYKSSPEQLLCTEHSFLSFCPKFIH